VLFLLYPSAHAHPAGQDQRGSQPYLKSSPVGQLSKMHWLQVTKISFRPHGFPPVMKYLIFIEYTVLDIKKYSIIFFGLVLIEELGERDNFRGFVVEWLIS
jgi:hypothetical protein